MRSGTGFVEFAEITICSEAQNEELRPATYRETAAAIFTALAESGLKHDLSDEGRWNCEIVLLDQYLDVEEQVPHASISH